MTTASERGRHMRINTASAAFGIVDPITLDLEYEPPLRCVVCTADATVAVELIDGSTGSWPLIANVESPGMQITKVLAAGTNLGGGTLKGLL